MKKKGKLLIFIFLTVVILSGCTKYEIIGEVDATVVNKEYRRSYATMVPTTIFDGKTTTTVLIPQHYPARYIVVLTYEDMTITINNKELYQTVEKEDQVKVSHYMSKDKDKQKIVYER